MNKHWEYTNGIYKLYFNQFYDDELIAELQYSEEDKDWLYSINLSKNKQEDWLLMDKNDVDIVKEIVEDMIEQFIKEEIEYYKDMLEKFVDKE